MFAPGEAREDWRILRALSGVMNQPLPFDTLDQLRVAMISVVPHLGAIDDIAPAAREAFGTAGAMTTDAFVSPVTDFYQTCSISRASVTMAKCTEAFVTPSAATGTGD